MSKDLELLQGCWRVTTLQMDGRSVAVPGNASVVIKGNRFTTSGMGADYKGTLEIDDSTRPSRLDMKFTAGPEKGKTNPAIYKLKGDTWIMCIATHGPSRPRSFATRSGSGFALETLSRGKPPVTKPAKKAVKQKQAAAPTEFAGDWAMVSGVMNGVAMEPAMVQWVRRVTEGNETTVTAGPQIMMRFAFTTDSAASPNEIDYVNTAGPNKGQAQLGIYQFKRGVLTICLAAPGKPRPKSFESVAGDGRSLTTWKKK